MNEIYEKGTKVMGWINAGYNGCDSYFDRPFFGEVLFYISSDDIYEVQAVNKVFPIRAKRICVTLFIQEMYDEAVKLYDESHIYYKKFEDNKKMMRDLLSPLEY